MLVKQAIPPGIVKVNTDYGEEGRWRDGNKVRFVAGLPEKLGGWAKATSSAVTGVCRGVCAWRDNTGVKRLGIGTHNKLYVYNEGVLTDITPFRGTVTGALTDPITTTSGSPTVTIAHTAHGQAANDYVMLTATTAVGGLTLAGVYQIASVPGANSYTITFGSNASGNASGGGSTAYTYYRKTLGSAPFATTSGSAVVAVTDASHASQNGDYVNFAGASAVAGLTISGAYLISGVTTNAYNITASGNANATTTGGGSAVTAQYEITSGYADAIEAFGWGVGTYNTPGANSMGWGSPRTSSVTLALRTWGVTNYGQQLLANPQGGGIYVWDPSTQSSARAVPLYNAPTQVLGMYVTDERFIIALGVGGDNLKIAWPDQNDSTAWTATATNTANSSRRVAGGSTLIGGLKLRSGLSLISTDTNLFTHQYTGTTFVFDTHNVGSGCGFFGPNSAVELGGVAFWMGQTDFWSFNGYPQPLPSDDIRDYVFRNINRTQRQKCIAATVVAKQEVWFFYPSASSTEIDSYVIYHTMQRVWSIGTLQRTAWVDQGLYAYPMALDASGYIYNHEYGADDDTAAMDSYITAAPQDLQDGAVNMDIFGILPDFKRQSGNLSLTLLTRYYPNDADTVSQTYTSTTSTQRIDTREAGKMAGFKIESNVIGGDYRVGALRFDVQPSGARR